MQLCYQYFTTGRNPGHGSEFCYRDDTTHIQYNSYTTTDHAYSVCLSLYKNAIAFINKVKLFFLSRPTKKTSTKSHDNALFVVCKFSWISWLFQATKFRCQEVNKYLSLPTIFYI